MSRDEMTDEECERAEGLAGHAMTVHLNEFDKLEWWDVCRSVRPDITEAEFDRMWSEFQKLKAKREAVHDLAS